MSNLIEHAKIELDVIGLREESEDEMNVAMRNHILHMVTEFAKEGHSGFSASYAINILTKLFSYKPLSPLTGDDSEWINVGDMHGGISLWQNTRCSRVFKDENGAWDIDGIHFWEWVNNEETGSPYKAYYTTKDSRVPIKFPYIPKTTDIYLQTDGKE